jgi:hypothetical protein
MSSHSTDFEIAKKAKASRVTRNGTFSAGRSARRSHFDIRFGRNFVVNHRLLNPHHHTTVPAAASKGGTDKWWLD